MESLKTVNRAIKRSLVLGSLFFGRYVLSGIVSSSRKVRGPEHLKSNESYWIKGDTGNILHVEFDGPEEGVPLILIHGLNASLEQWYYQRLFFRNRYRLVLIDLPGHGKSLPPKDFTIDALARDVRRIIEYFKIHRPFLYGHSIGGMITLKYCLQYRNNPGLRGIILQHCTYTNAFKTIVFPLVFQLLEKPVLVPFLKWAIRNNTAVWALGIINFLVGVNHLFFRYIYFTGNQTSQQLRFMALLSAGVAPATVARGIIEATRFDVKNQLGQIEVPALVMGAVRDRITTLNASVHIHNKISGSELKVLNEGHLSLVENPSEVNESVKYFIEKLE